MANSNLNLSVSYSNDDTSHLPFVERFRPKKLDDILSHENIVKTLKSFMNTKNIPHLLFYGPPGTGKTSTIDSFVAELYGIDNIEYMTMNINASEERGIEIVRNKIKQFVSTIPVYQEVDNKDIPTYKFVILDEADAMTSDAQAMLRQVMETYTFNARFCLICNYIKRIDQSLQSRCTQFKFSPLDFANVKTKVVSICNKLDINMTEDGIRTLWKLSTGDMRKVLHGLQVISINYKMIDSDVITKFQSYPTKKDIDNIYAVLLKDNFNKCMKDLNILIHEQSYTLSDIVTELGFRITDDLINKKVDKEIGCKILQHLRSAEMSIISSSSHDMQIPNVVGSFVGSR